MHAHSLPILLVLLLSPLLFSHACVRGEEVVSYDGYKVARIVLENKAQIDYVSAKELDVWSRDGHVVLGAENDIMMKESDMEHLHNLRTPHSLTHPSLTVLIEDVQKHIDSAQKRVQRRVVDSTASAFFDAYHTYAEIITFIKNITSSYSKLATLVPSIGSSIEGRDIPAIEIKGGKGVNKKSIFISGGQHAREWIASATALFILESLLTGYGTDAAITTLIDNFNVHIVPLVNPDGYEFTHTSNRLWRKNRRVNSNKTFGVDLNRNWDEHWCKYGSSTSPSSDTYCGTAPFSEPETNATSRYISSFSFDALIDFHSYGQLILRPYGWNTSLPINEALLKDVGDNMAAVIKKDSGKVYTSEHGADLYAASGAADDWSFSVAEVPLVYTIELRDTGLHGFQLPPAQIIPTGTEAFLALQYLSTRA